MCGALEIDNYYYPIWAVIGEAQLRAGLAQEGIASLKQVVELAPWYTTLGWHLATAYHQAGDYEHSQELVQRLAGSHGHTVRTAVYYAACLMWHTSSAMPTFLIQYAPSSFDPYRADPRFRALLQRINIA